MGCSRCGFILMELLIAMALISMFCVFGALRLGESIEEHELSAAALSLAADLHWLRQISINSPSGAGGPVYSMTFDHAAGSYYYVTGGVKIVKRVILAEMVRFQNAPAILSFSQSGAPSRGQSILLQSRKGRHKYVIIAAVSGRIRISDSPVKETGE